LRSLNRRPEAIIVLSNLLPAAKTEDEAKLITAWRCFIEQEQMVLDSVISIYDMNFSACLDLQYFMNDTVENSSSMVMQQTSINQLSQKEMILYPNPSTAGFYLESKENLQLDKITLYDATGKKVNASIALTNEKQLYIDTKNLVAGMYLVRYQLSDKEKAEFKVTVLK